MRNLPAGYRAGLHRAQVPLVIKIGNVRVKVVTFALPDTGKGLAVGLTEIARQQQGVAKQLQGRIPAPG